MNNKRKELLQDVAISLRSLSEDVSEVLEDKELCMGKAPESGVDFEEYVKIEEAFDYVEEAENNLNEAAEIIESIVGRDSDKLVQSLLAFLRKIH